LGKLKNWPIRLYCITIWARLLLQAQGIGVSFSCLRPGTYVSPALFFAENAAHNLPLGAYAGSLVFA
jgi:hypothetical protein